MANTTGLKWKKRVDCDEFNNITKTWCYTFDNGISALVYRSNKLGRKWYINLSYPGAGNIFNSGNGSDTLKHAKDKVMRGYMAYFAMNLAGKWNTQYSFLDEEFNVENPTIRFEPFRFKRE